MSVFFDPEDYKYPIIRIPLEKVTGCGKWTGKLSERFPETFFIRSESITLMKEKGIDHPYRTEQVSFHFLIFLFPSNLSNLFPSKQQFSTPLF